MQELICSPADILAYPEREGDASIGPLACTVTALLTHATPYSPPKDIGADHGYHSNGLDDPALQEPTETSLEVNYYHRQPGRYAEDRFISNFNFGYNNNYTIDESEEFHLNYENANEPSSVGYSPVYNDGLRNRGPYYQNNRIQFVTPFCKQGAVLTSEDYEIYDTDEVDYPLEIRDETDLVGRYDRDKLNLDLQSNNNSAVAPLTETNQEREHRILVTWLCLGTFFVSAILLIWFPL